MERKLYDTGCMLRPYQSPLDWELTQPDEPSESVGCIEPMEVSVMSSVERAQRTLTHLERYRLKEGSRGKIRVDVEKTISRERIGQGDLCPLHTGS